MSPLAEGVCSPLLVTRCRAAAPGATKGPRKTEGVAGNSLSLALVTHTKREAPCLVMLATRINHLSLSQGLFRRNSVQLPLMEVILLVLFQTGNLSEVWQTTAAG